MFLQICSERYKNLISQGYKVRFPEASPSLFRILLLAALPVQHTPDSVLLLVVLLPAGEAHSVLVEEARALFDRQQDCGEQGDQVVQEGVVKGGGLLRVVDGQSRLDVVGCPSTNASRAAHDVVEEEEVVVEGGLQVVCQSHISCLIVLPW